MARVASRRTRTLLFAAVLLPLWASYLARVYAWILILNHSGVLNWSLLSIGLPPANIGSTNTAMWVVFTYIWLPFMIIPVYAALERVPESLIEAAADLGARRWRTLRDVILPLSSTGVLAPIFTFSLSWRYITGAGRRRELQFHRQRGLRKHRHANIPCAASRW
jgi:putative spermidine/putrescine transport system permease protein